MKSLRELYRIGKGPSSSHTMGPRFAAARVAADHPEAVTFRVTLYGSLAATGKGHMTDQAIIEAMEPRLIDVVWKADETLPEHPNGMRFEALDASGRTTAAVNMYSVGGGAVKIEGEPIDSPDVYDLDSMDDIIEWANRGGEPLHHYVEESEGKKIWDFLAEVLSAMRRAVKTGLATEGVLPGGLKLERKSHSYHLKSRRQDPVFQRTGLLSSYALAVAEENAAGGIVVTAPTCGSCGVLPAVLTYLVDLLDLPDGDAIRALGTAGLVGNVIKRNASISGAEAGCQAEIGSACAMAAAAAADMMGGSVHQIEYAAEMGLEHHLGLTCDPVGGLVQIPCVERNAAAATRAVDCADLALLSDGRHRISFDEVVETMRQTGLDIKSSYRETSRGGLARIFSKHHYHS